MPFPDTRRCMGPAAGREPWLPRQPRCPRWPLGKSLGFARRGVRSDRGSDPPSGHLRPRVGLRSDLLTDSVLLLLHEDEVLGAPDHVFHVGDLVPWNDDEEGRILPRAFVILDRDVDLLDATVVAALAHNGECLDDAREGSVHVLDLLVDRTEERLVRSDPRLPIGIGCVANSHRAAILLPVDHETRGRSTVPGSGRGREPLPGSCGLARLELACAVAELVCELSSLLLAALLNDFAGAPRGFLRDRFAAVECFLACRPRLVFQLVRELAEAGVLGLARRKEHSDQEPDCSGRNAEADRV